MRRVCFEQVLICLSTQRQKLFAIHTHTHTHTHAQKCAFVCRHLTGACSSSNSSDLKGGGTQQIERGGYTNNSDLKGGGTQINTPDVNNTENVKSNKTFYTNVLWDGEIERLDEEQQKEKEKLIKELTKRLSGPLADEDGNVPTGIDRPTAIEVDGPSHFYANSTRYTAYTKLKHRLLTRMGYKVLHVPYFEWRKLRGAKEREEYMSNKLKEEPSEWLDPQDEKYYNERMQQLRKLSETEIDLHAHVQPTEEIQENKAQKTKQTNAKDVQNMENNENKIEVNKEGGERDEKNGVAKMPDVQEQSASDRNKQNAKVSSHKGKAKRLPPPPPKI